MGRKPPSAGRPWRIACASALRRLPPARTYALEGKLVSMASVWPGRFWRGVAPDGNTAPADGAENSEPRWMDAVRPRIRPSAKHLHRIAMGAVRRRGMADGA
jgi:hypothetical protein